MFAVTISKLLKNISLENIYLRNNIWSLMANYVFCNFCKLVKKQAYFDCELYYKTFSILRLRPLYTFMRQFIVYPSTVHIQP